MNAGRRSRSLTDDPETSCCGQRGDWRQTALPSDSIDPQHDNNYLITEYSALTGNDSTLICDLAVLKLYWRFWSLDLWALLVMWFFLSHCKIFKIIWYFLRIMSAVIPDKDFNVWFYVKNFSLFELGLWPACYRLHLKVSQFP